MARFSIDPQYDDDGDVKCDACGQPTPRLDPLADVELCDACFRAEQHAADIAAANDPIVTQRAADWLVNGNDPRR